MATVHNKGGTNVTYSKTEFMVDGLSVQNITQSVSVESTNIANITWQATYGNHK